MVDDMDPRAVANLALALSKAQAAFPAIPRDKTVTVKTRTGGEYTFKYAPLDTVLAKVREPLAANGLAISQLLDGGYLVTLLIHESGQYLEGRTPLPRDPDDTVQAFGSAITYLRRYAIQALLGIATEEDDDGNRASGNKARTQPDRAKAREEWDAAHDEQPDLGRPELERRADGLIGTVVKGATPADLELRYDPDGIAFWGFKLKAGKTAYQAFATGPLAEQLRDAAILTSEAFEGQRVAVWGKVEMVPWFKGDKAMPPYARIVVERLATSEWAMPPLPDTLTVPMFDEAGS
jgi:hypothetical protein